MTAKQDDTSKLVMRIIISVCGVALMFIGSSVDRRIGRIEESLATMQKVSDIDGTTFKVKFTINDARLIDLETRMRNAEISQKRNSKEIDHINEN